MSTVTKRNRFVRTPTGKGIDLSRSMALDTIDPLQTFKYLPSTYLYRLGPKCHLQYFKNRLTDLRHDAGLIDCPPSSWHAANARYRPAVYQLTEKGFAELAAHGRARRVFATNEDFAHEFGSCLTAASFWIGAQIHPEIKLYDHEAILGSKHCPASTRLSKTPFKTPVTFNYHYSIRGNARHKELTTFVKHDWMPFGFVSASDPKSQMFFPGIEFDRHTESLESEDYSATTISKKMQAIEALAKDDGYHSRYGIPNAFILWVTISEARMRSLMRVLEDVVGKKGSKRHLFTHIPDFASFESFPPADGSMLIRNWKRVGYPDMNILAELGVK